MNYLKTLAVGIPMTVAFCFGLQSCDEKTPQNSRKSAPIKCHYTPGDPIKTLDYEIRPFTNNNGYMTTDPDTLPIVNGDVFELEERIHLNHENKIIDTTYYYNNKEYNSQVKDLYDSLAGAAKDLAKKAKHVK